MKSSTSFCFCFLFSKYISLAIVSIILYTSKFPISLFNSNLSDFLIADKNAWYSYQSSTVLRLMYDT